MTGCRYYLYLTWQGKEFYTRTVILDRLPNEFCSQIGSTYLQHLHFILSEIPHMHTIYAFLCLILFILPQICFTIPNKVREGKKAQKAKLIKPIQWVPGLAGRRSGCDPGSCWEQDPGFRKLHQCSRVPVPNLCKHDSGYCTTHEWQSFTIIL